MAAVPDGGIAHPLTGFAPPGAYLHTPSCPAPKTEKMHPFCGQGVHLYQVLSPLPCRDGDFDTMSIKISVPTFCSKPLKTVVFRTF